MIAYVKRYWWALVGLFLIILGIIFRDIAIIENLKSFARRKKVEDDVRVIKDAIAGTERDIAAEEDKLADIAEEMRRRDQAADKASPEEIKDFFDDYFKNKE